MKKNTEKKEFLTDILEQMIFCLVNKMNRNMVDMKIQQSIS